MLCIDYKGIYAKSEDKMVWMAEPNADEQNAEFIGKNCLIRLMVNKTEICSLCKVEGEGISVKDL